MPLTGQQILVVEDDSFFASLLHFLLQRQGAMVTVLSDGRSAIESLDKPVFFDAVLLDLRLPQVSGLEVLKTLRLHPNWGHTPVLVLSAIDKGSEVAEVLAAGADDYMSKPFNPEELLARLSRLLPDTGLRT